MQIKNLDLLNFRNYEDLQISFSPSVNIIYGENGQGKTNILESIYFCGLGKSHRSSHDEEIINFKKKETHIKAVFDTTRGNTQIDIHLKKGSSKGIAVNRLPIKKISELYGKINIVIFSPTDMEIIKRGPGVRRDFINLELCQLDPIYVDNLIKYTRILKQRHELLKKMESDKCGELQESLDIWDLQLSGYGKKIIERRREFINELEALVYDIHYDISAGKEKLKIKYDPSVTEENFYEELLKTRGRDLLYKNTSVGPHRDDIIFYANDKDLKAFGSQGQQRTCVLSLKLAELKILEKHKKDTPILLLDDVLSELDRGRQKELLNRIEGIQTLITGTGIDEFVEHEVKNAEKYLVKDGKIETEV